MTDIALRIVSAPGEPLRFDIALEGYDLAADNGLRTAVLLSLFTDRRADDDDVVEDEDRRGWWADPKRGSRLWLLERAKETLDTLARAKHYVEEALAWLLEDGIARAVTVEAEWVRSGVLGLRIEIARADGSRYSELFDYSLGG